MHPVSYTHLTAMAGWKRGYLVFLICIPIILIVMLTVPKGEVLPKTEKAKSGISGSMVYFGALCLITGIFVATFNTNIAMYIDRKGIGDASTCLLYTSRGLDYNHGTGHGVGYLLNIHEGPAGFRWQYRAGETQPFEEGMIITDEPGIYIEAVSYTHLSVKAAATTIRLRTLHLR